MLTLCAQDLRICNLSVLVASVSGMAACLSATRTNTQEHERLAERAWMVLLSDRQPVLFSV